VEFIHQLKAGEYLIPTFQRLFVWDPENIVALWESIYECYPIGNILCWKTPIVLNVHRTLGGFFVPGDSNSKRKWQTYILDGQQRATSLMISFYGGKGLIREHYSFDYALYFDSINRAFFFEKDYYRHRWNAEPGFLIRLKDVIDLPDDYCRFLEGLPGFSPSVVENLEQLKYVLANYHIPLVNLSGFDIAAVCAIYERINQTGHRLKNMDILIARGFKNYATVVEEDFPVSE